MFEIRHKESGAVLHRVEGETLEGATLFGLNLSGADLAEANLAGANLSGCLFRFADLRGAKLTRANLGGAYLPDADLRDADLTGADLLVNSLDRAELTGANLTGANLTGAYLAEAKLVGATLLYANFQSAYLGGADLTGARMAFTILTDCPSLPDADGLEEIEHLGPSSLDLSTLRAGASRLPERFLHGVGLAREEIASLRVLYSAPIPDRSCRILHADADHEPAERLRIELWAHGISCWRYQPEVQGGYLVQTAFFEAMKRHDRLVFLCSRHSLTQDETRQPVIRALEREQETGRRVLCPISLDEFLGSAELRQLADRMLAAGEWRLDWLHMLRDRPIPEFRSGMDGRAYQAQLAILLGGLSTPAGPVDSARATR